MMKHACYHCQSEIHVHERIGRRDTCTHCGADLHCCRNCAFYDLHYADACREPQAEPVGDKEAGNFCEFFRLSDYQTRQPSHAAGGTNAADARARLEALFRKKS